MALFKKYGDQVQFIVADVETSSGRRLAERFNVFSIPAMFFINREGKVVDNYVGELSYEQLEAKILKIAP